MTIYGDDLSAILLTTAYNKGWRLYEWSMIPRLDPIQLRDRNGQILYEWDYAPSLTTIFEVCERLFNIS